jgi:hypothetical protein
MPSVNLTQLEYNVYQTRQTMEIFKRNYDDAVKKLAEGKATYARRAARGVDEPDTDEEEDENEETHDSTPVESLPDVSLPSFEYHSAKDIARLTKIYTNPKKILAAWKRVLSHGLHKNIKGILEECRDTFLEEEMIEDASPDEIREVLKDWDAFCNKVYMHLKENGSFLTGDEDIFQDFEDTAGGCDEITWDAACDVIKKMVKATGAAPAPPAPIKVLVTAPSVPALPSRMIYSQADADQVMQGY